MLNYPCVILAGGKSSRMGKDKSLLPFNNYQTMTEFQVKKLEAIFSKIYISAKNNKFNFDINLIIDNNEIYSPMIALSSILEKFNGFVFIISVDSPFVGKNEILKLEENLLGFDAVIAKTSNFSHPLCGFYHSKLGEIAKNLANKNIHKIKALFDLINLKEVFFENEEVFLNLNYLSQYHKANNVS